MSTTENQPNLWKAFRQEIHAAFDLEELRGMTFDLSIDYEDGSLCSSRRLGNSHLA